MVIRKRTSLQRQLCYVFVNSSLVLTGHRAWGVMIDDRDAALLGMDMLQPYKNSHDHHATNAATLCSMRELGSLMSQAGTVAIKLAFCCPCPCHCTCFCIHTCCLGLTANGNGQRAHE